MVRPANFGYNEETAANNAFQQNDSSLNKTEISEKAIAEFDLFVDTLQQAGVKVLVAQDTEKPVKPDACFPNNWITTHSHGVVITYPMFAKQRRLERQPHIIQLLREEFVVNTLIQYEYFEEAGLFLEGTGSMIMDRPHQLVYACQSPRTSPILLDKFCKRLDIKKILFKAVDGEGIPIYHTNVMMALGEEFVVICLDTIHDGQERADLLRQFKTTGKAVINISIPQMMSFVGNMLQLRSATGDPLLVMSTQAYQALSPDQISQLEKHGRLVHSPIDTIETYGGGSARCMIAEIFLQPRTSRADRK